MCRLGGFQDFHGIGVANLIFGLACIILPDHSTYNAETLLSGMDQGDVFRATAGITIINGLLFLTAGILLMVLARRLVENLATHQVTQISAVFLMLSVFVCPITFALNVVGVNTADSEYTPYEGDGTTISGPVGNLTIDASTFLSSIMFADRYTEYKFATSAVLTLIAVGSFFMNITCVIIIYKERILKCLGRASEEEVGSPTSVPDTSRIQYQNQVNEDRAVAIQPLPERPGPGIHAHFADASMPAYRNSAFA